MSWSISYQTDGAHFVHDTDAVEGGQIGYAENESKEAVAAAKTAIKGLIASGVLGGDSVGYTISASGHANLAHQPSGSWVNDTITISISQSASVPVATEEPAQVEEIQAQADVEEEPTPEPQAGILFSGVTPVQEDPVQADLEEPPAAA